MAPEARNVAFEADVSLGRTDRLRLFGGGPQDGHRHGHGSGVPGFEGFCALVEELKLPYWRSIIDKRGFSLVRVA